jgi:hypothetical protein
VTQGDVKDPSGALEPAETPEEEAAPERPAAPTPPVEPVALPAAAGPSAPAEPAPPVSAVPPEPTPETPAPTGEATTPAAAPESPPDEISQLVRIGQVGSGRRLGPPDDALRSAVRDFASQRHLPGLGTLVELARAHADSDRGPTLGVEAFSEIRSQLGRLVADLEAVAIQVGPVLFLKTSAKNQPGTALRWLHADERRVLHEHPELLDHPGRLVANLRKRTAGEE